MFSCFQRIGCMEHDSQLSFSRPLSSQRLFIASGSLILLGHAAFLCLVFYINPAPNIPLIFAATCFWFSIACLFAIPAFRSVTVDKNGIAQRILFWSDCWRWDDFSNRKVLKLDRHALRHTERRFLRTMDFSFLADTDKRTLYDAINLRFSDSPLPAASKFEFDLGDREFRVDEHGVHEKSDAENWLLNEWNKLTTVSIHKYDPVRRDFRIVILRFENAEISIEAIQRKSKIPLRIQSAILSAVERNVSNGQILETYTGDTITDDLLICHEIKTNRSRTRELLYVVTMLAVIVLLMSLTGQRDPIPWIFSHVVVFGPLISLCCIRTYRRNRNLERYAAIAR